MGRLDNPILHADVEVSINGGAATTYFAHVPHTVSEKWCKKDVGVAGGEHLPIDYFRIGEGGWVAASGGIKVRREPDPSLSNLDCIENQDRYPGPVTSRYYFEKAITTLSYEADRKAKIDCGLLTSEANSDGAGNPDFWEVALFDTGDNMIAYATIDKLTKDVSKYVDFVFRIYR